MTPADFLANPSQNLATNKTQLESPAFRESLYRRIHPRADRGHLALLRILFALEAAARESDDGDHEHFENLYWCALFLHQIGDLDDVLPMWRAKNLNMDTGCGFDAQFLVGAGVEATCQFLQQADDPDAPLALEYIQANADGGTFADLALWHEERVRYFEVE